MRALSMSVYVSEPAQAASKADVRVRASLMAILSALGQKTDVRVRASLMAILSTLGQKTEVH